MAGLPGYRFLGGSARRWEDPRGVTISRRQYENRRARRAGWMNWNDYLRFRRSEWGSGVARDMKPRSPEPLSPSHVEYHEVYVEAAERPRWGELQGKRVDQTPLGQRLIAEGKRPPFDVWPISNPIDMRPSNL